MRRVVILVPGASGKPTLAARLGPLPGLDVFELDEIFPCFSMSRSLGAPGGPCAGLESAPISGSGAEVSTTEPSISHERDRTPRTTRHSARASRSSCDRAVPRH